MYEKLKTEIKEILNVVKELPDKFQDKCFELLLSNFLEKQKEIPKPEISKLEKPELAVVPGKLKETDVNMKVRAFLKKNNLNIAQIEKLFYFDKGEIEPIFKLKTTKFAHAQIQLSLLSALKEAIASGYFRFNVEDVRELCRQKLCYDGANFMHIFDRYNNLFRSLQKKEEPIELSEDGLKELANTIRELTEEAED